MAQDADNNTETKRESSPYPYTSLKSALQISDAVKDCGGNRTDVSKGALASHLGEPEKSQAFLQRITSAKAFGLIEGRSDYCLTEIAKRIYFPITESDKSKALLECLVRPSAFRELVKRFDGDKLPKREILANVLHRELGVPESWKDRAASFFENSAQIVGAIDEKGFLRFNAAKHSATIKSMLVQGPEPKQSEELGDGKSDQWAKEFSDQETHELYLDREKIKRVKLACPLILTQGDYDRICNWIKATWIVEDENPQKV